MSSRRNDSDSISRRVENSKKEVEKFRAEYEQLLQRGLTFSNSNSASDSVRAKSPKDESDKGNVKSSVSTASRTTVSESVFNDSAGRSVKYESGSERVDFTSGTSDVRSKYSVSPRHSGLSNKSSDSLRRSDLNSDHSIKTANSERLQMRNSKSFSGKNSDKYSSDFCSSNEVAQSNASLNQRTDSKNVLKSTEPVKSKSFTDDMKVSSVSGINNVTYEQKTIANLMQPSALETKRPNILDIVKSRANVGDAIKRAKPKVSPAKTSEEKLVCPSKHKKNYNVEEAREFMRKQKEKRIEEMRKKLKESENTVEEKKKKLRELDERSLKIIAKNRERSRSRSKDPQRVSDAPLQTIDVNQRLNPVNEKRPSRDRVKAPDERHLTYRLGVNKSKVKAAIVIQSHFRGYRQRGIYKKMLDENVRKMFLEEPEESSEQTKESLQLKREQNTVLKRLKGNAELNLRKEQVLKDNAELNQRKEQVLNEETDLSETNSRKENIAHNQDAETVEPKPTCDRNYGNRSQKQYTVPESITQLENEHFPEWLQAKQTYPYNFISAVKQKLNLALNLPAKTSEIGVQSSPQVSTKVSRNEDTTSFNKSTDNKHSFKETAQTHSSKDIAQSKSVNVVKKTTEIKHDLKGNHNFKKPVETNTQTHSSQKKSSYSSPPEIVEPQESKSSESPKTDLKELIQKIEKSVNCSITDYKPQRILSSKELKEKITQNITRRHNSPNSQQIDFEKYVEMNVQSKRRNLNLDLKAVEGLKLRTRGSDSDTSKNVPDLFSEIDSDSAKTSFSGKVFDENELNSVKTSLGSGSLKSQSAKDEFDVFKPKQSKSPSIDENIKGLNSGTISLMDHIKNATSAKTNLYGKTLNLADLHMMNEGIESEYSASFEIESANDKKQGSSHIDEDIKKSHSSIHSYVSNSKHSGEEFFKNSHNIKTSSDRTADLLKASNDDFFKKPFDVLKKTKTSNKENTVPASSHSNSISSRKSVHSEGLSDSDGDFKFEINTERIKEMKLVRRREPKPDFNNTIEAIDAFSSNKSNPGSEIQSEPETNRSKDSQSIPLNLDKFSLGVISSNKSPLHKHSTSESGSVKSASNKMSDGTVNTKSGISTHSGRSRKSEEVSQNNPDILIQKSASSIESNLEVISPKLNGRRDSIISSNCSKSPNLVEKKDETIDPLLASYRLYMEGFKESQKRQRKLRDDKRKSNGKSSSSEEVKKGSASEINTISSKTRPDEHSKNAHSLDADRRSPASEILSEKSPQQELRLLSEKSASRSLSEKGSIASQKSGSLSDKGSIASRQSRSLSEKGSITSRELRLLSAKSPIASHELRSLSEKSPIASNELRSLSGKSPTASHEIRLRSERSPSASHEIRTLSERSPNASHDLRLSDRSPIVSHEIRSSLSRSCGSKSPSNLDVPAKNSVKQYELRQRSPSEMKLRSNNVKSSRGVDSRQHFRDHEIVYYSSSSESNRLTSEIKSSSRITSRGLRRKSSLMENEYSFKTMQSASSESGFEGREKQTSESTTIDERLSSEIAPPLKIPDVSLHSNHDSDKENRVEIKVKAGERNGVTTTTNQIHVKFEAELHLLHDFNESMRQVVAIEKSLLKLENNKSNVQRETRDTQTSFVSKSISNENSRLNEKSSMSKSSPSVATLNYSRGSEFFPERSSIIEESHISNNDFSVNNSCLITNSLLLENTALEVSEMHDVSAQNDESFELSKLFSKDSDEKKVYAGLSLGMFEQLIKDEDARIENLKTILKIREKALLDRTKGELACLEIQKKQLLETGKLHEASLVKKKQRGILIKLQHEKHEMQKLKQMQKAASKERKTILKEQRNMIKTQLSTAGTVTRIKRTASKERRSSGPLRVYNYHRETTVKSETSISKSSIAGELVYTSKSESVVGDKKYDSDEAEVESLLVNSRTEIAKRSLVMREAALQKRRKAAEELLQWHQKLLDEERRITELEMAASNIINQVPSLTVDNTTSAQSTYKFLGSQLNVLWQNMTGLAEKKFKDMETYNLTQIALERFCKDAKKHSSKKSIVGECNASDSSMHEIMQNISCFTDEISELYKLSSAKNEGGGEELKADRTLQSESVRNNRQLSLNKDNLNEVAIQKHSDKKPRSHASIENQRNISEHARRKLTDNSKRYNSGTKHIASIELINARSDAHMEIKKHKDPPEERSISEVEDPKSRSVSEVIESIDESEVTKKELIISSRSDIKKERKSHKQQRISESISSLDNEQSAILDESIQSVNKVTKTESLVSEEGLPNVESTEKSITSVNTEDGNLNSANKSSSVHEKLSQEILSTIQDVDSEKHTQQSEVADVLSKNSSHIPSSQLNEDEEVKTGQEIDFPSLEEKAFSPEISSLHSNKKEDSVEIASQQLSEVKTTSNSNAELKQSSPAEELVSVASNIYEDKHSSVDSKQSKEGTLHELTAKVDGSILVISETSQLGELHSNIYKAIEDLLTIESQTNETSQRFEPSINENIPSISIHDEDSVVSKDMISEDVAETNIEDDLVPSITNEDELASKVESKEADNEIASMEIQSSVKSNECSNEIVSINSLKHDNLDSEIPSKSVNEVETNEESSLKMNEGTSYYEIGSDLELETKDDVPSNSSEVVEDEKVSGNAPSQVSVDLKPLARISSMGKDAKNSHNSSVKQSFVPPKTDVRIASDDEDSSKITDHLGEVEEEHEELPSEIISELKINEDGEVNSIDEVLSNGDGGELGVKTESVESDAVEENSVVFDEIESNANEEESDKQQISQDNSHSDELENSSKSNETSLVSGKREASHELIQNIPIEDDNYNKQDLDKCKQADETDDCRKIPKRSIFEDFNSAFIRSAFEDVIQSRVSCLSDDDILDLNASIKEIEVNKKVAAVGEDLNSRIESDNSLIEEKVEASSSAQQSNNSSKVDEVVELSLKENEGIKSDEGTSIKDEEELKVIITEDKEDSDAMKSSKIDEASTNSSENNSNVELSKTPPKANDFQDGTPSPKEANNSYTVDEPSSSISSEIEGMSSDDASEAPIIEVTIEDRKKKASILEKEVDSEEGEASDVSKAQVGVKQRVSEILADAHIGSTVGDKSPRMQDLYVTTYDVITPEDSPELGSPVENKSFSPKDIYGNEAEELLRKQLAIEQEIKQLEQQQLPYVYMREIPNKPPPPYTPPVQTASNLPPTVLPMTVEQITSMTPKISNILYEAQKQNGLADATLPDDISTENIDEDCWELVFDLCKEYSLEHYKQFEEISTVSWMKPTNRQTGFKREFNQSRLKDYLDQRLMQVFEFEKVETKESMIIKWSRKKRDHVDELLVVESQAEEAEWTNYNQDELSVRNEVTNDIMKLLLGETAEIFRKIVAKRN